MQYNNKGVSVSNVKTDSRLIKYNDVFVDIASNAEDSYKHISQAIEMGAKAIYTDKIFESHIFNRSSAIHGDQNTFQLHHVTNIYQFLSEYLDQHKWKQPKYKAAITGTNGKTSCAHYIMHIANLLGLPSASIGTLGLCDVSGCTTNHVEPDITLGLTTNDLLTNYKLLDYCSTKMQAQLVTMEFSSHAASQKRLLGIVFDSLIITNIYSDHLDYHGTKENYINTKISIITTKDIYGNYIKSGYLLDNSPIIVTEEVFKQYIEPEQRLYMFLISKHQLVILSQSPIYNDNSKLPTNVYNAVYKPSEKRVDIQIISKINQETIKFIPPLATRFQITNICLSLLNLKFIAPFCFKREYKNAKENEYQSIENIDLSSLKHPSGRAEIIPYGSNLIVIDAAHTADAIQTILSEILHMMQTRNMQNGRLIIVFGCGGDRDKTKRGPMAQIASSLADVVIITDDNPRYEDPSSIRTELMYNVTSGAQVFELAPRHDAIKLGIDMLTRNDILVIAGRGHESYQIIQGKHISSNDKNIVLNITNKYVPEL